MNEGQVAVVGMAVRAPGAETPGGLWDRLTAGAVCLPGTQEDSGGLVAMGQVDRLAEFDAALFNFSPLQARVADPQHRASLELAWLALEDAGVAVDERVVGVFVGCGPATYERLYLSDGADATQAAGSQQVALLNDRDFLASGLAFRLGLRGPSITVQSACATSLVAVHLAVRSLLTYETDIAIAGGVTLHPPEASTYRYRAGDILSPDGKCRPFTRGSNGTVPSGGGGMVVLQRLEDARRRQDRARAVIVGSAVGNDGAGRISEAAPSPDGHERVIREALTVAGLTPESVAFVQTHGTGTALGDSVELAALGATYGKGPGGPVALGAIKANIGHTDTAAGVLGLAAAVLALEHDTIPAVPRQPQDGADVPLPGRLVLPRSSQSWPETSPRRAAVSSVGLGGTNAHVVLEAADPEVGAAETWTAPEIVAISAADETALRRRAEDLAAAVGAAADLGAVCRTLWHRRRHLRVRTSLVVRSADPADARREIAAGLTTIAQRGDVMRPQGAVALLLPGQGAGVTAAGEGLSRWHPGFNRHREELVALVRAAGGPDLREFASGPRPNVDTTVVQPWLFVTELALVRTLEDLGVRPGLLLGHSIGELVAAAHAGVFSNEDAARAVVARGQLMGQMEAGSMIAVAMGEDGIGDLLDGTPVELAAVNGARSVVLSGPSNAVDRLSVRLSESGVRTRWLSVSHAFHSASMTSAAEGLAEVLASMTLQPPRMLVLSNVTGTALSDADAIDPTYWARQLRGTVRFRACAEELMAATPGVVLEAGPGKILGGLIRGLARPGSSAPVIHSVLGATTADEPSTFLGALAVTWEAGNEIDLPLSGPGQPAELPPYPLSRTRYWAGNDQGSQGKPAPAKPVTKSAVSASADADLLALVAGSWQRSFGGPDVGNSDNFFELGGTSLQAVQLVNDLADDLVLNLGLHDLYEHSTLTDFVSHLDVLLAERDASPEFAALLEEMAAADAEVRRP